MRRSWKMWLIVLIALLGLTEGIGLLLLAQDSATASGIVQFTGRIIANVWVIYGLIVWRAVPWVRRFGILLLSTAAGLMLALIFRAMGWTDMVTALVGIYIMAVVFYGGLWLIRIILSPGYSVLGVARTLIDEAVHMKITLVAAINVAILIAILPFLINQDDFLKYRISSFLTWSLMTTSGLLSLMTLFLAIATITQEQTQRQIFLTLSKPVHRGEYLLGKWLGITLLNLLLLSVACAGIYAFTLLLVQQPARDSADRQAVNSQVLVARHAVEPTAPNPNELKAMFEDRLRVLRAENPVRYGAPDSPSDTLEPGDRADIEQTVMVRWFSIPSRGTKAYRFTDLDDAARYNQPLQLRFKPKLSGKSADGFCYIGLRINGRPYYHPVISPSPGQLKLAEGNYHVLDIDPSVLGDGGIMDVEISNPLVNGQPQPSLSFNPKDGVEVLYRVGNFEGNLVRTAGVIWLRLVFLAMLGLAAGSYLSFPVAALVCMLIYFAASTNAYLVESIRQYAAFPKEALPWWDKFVWVILKLINLIMQGEFYELFKLLISLVGSGFMLISPSFGELNATPLVADGRLVPMSMVMRAVIWAGLIWTGLVGFIGWLIFRGKELARVTV